MKLRPGITPKLTFIFVGFAALLLAGVASLAYTNGRNALQQAAISELQSIATEKESALVEWEQDKQSALQTLVSLSELELDIVTFRSARSDSLEAQVAHDKLVDLLRPWADEDKDFLGLLVMDPDTAEIIAATRTDEEGKFKETFPYFIHGREGLYLQSAYYSPELQDLAMTVSAPVKTADGRLLGVLAGRLNLDQLNAIIQRRSGLHQTDDAFLVSASNLFITQPRFISDPAVLRRGIHTEGVKRCLLQENGALAYRDYQNELVIGIYHWLPEFDMCLIVKLDQAEAFEPSRAFGQTLLILSLAVLAVASVLAIGLARTIVRPLRSLQSGVVRFGQGFLDARLPETSKDELGVLASEFNHMAVSLAEKDAQLREYATHLEQKVLERTAALQENEASFRLMFASNPLPMWVYDLKTLKFLEVNDVAVENYGYTRDEFLQMTIADIRPFEDQARLQEDIARDRPALQHSGQWQHRLKDGRVIDVEIISHTLELSGKRAALVVAQDITQRKQAEAALRESESLKAAILASALDCIITIDYQGRIIEFNPAALATFGYSLEDVLGKEMVDLIIPPAFREQHRHGFTRYLATGESKILGKRLELTGLRADGSEFPVELTIQHVPSSDPPIFTGFLRDITERKQAQAQNNFHARLLRHVNDAVIATDVKFYITAWNRAAERTYGWTAEEAMGRNAAEMMSSGLNDEQRTKAVERLKEGSTSRSERIHHRKDGQPIYVEANTIALTDERGKMTGYVSVNRDITERKRAEEQNRFQANLVANVSDAIIAVDMQFNVQSWNPAAEAMYGWKAEEALERPSKEILETDFLETTREAVTKQVMEKGHWLGEVLQQRRDGTSIPTLSSLSLYKDSEGKPAGVIAVNRDITERKQAEEALAASERRFRALVENSSMLINLINREGVLTYVSPSSAYVVGFTPKEMVGRKVVEFLHPDEIHDKERPLPNMFRSPGTVVKSERRVRHKDGTWRWVEGYSTNLLDDQAVGALVFNYRDITDRKQAEEALRESESHAHSLLNLSKQLERAQTYSEVLDAALNQVREVLSYQNVWTYLLSEDKRHLRLLTTTGDRSRELTEDFPILKIEGDRFLEEIVEGKDIVIVEDARTDPRTNKDIVTQLGNRTIVNVPILLMEKHLGTFGTGSFGDEGVRVPTPTQQDYLRALASHMAVTLDRVHLLVERKQTEERFRLVVESAPNAIVLVNEQGKVSMVNSQTEKFFGYDRTELIEINIESLVPERFRGKHMGYRASYFVVLQARSMGVGRDLYGLRKDGSEFPVEIGLTPIETPEGPLVMATIVDITQRKRAEERQDFLANASRALASSLDYETTLSTVAQLAVPRIADWCTVYLTTPDDSIEQVAMTDADPEKVKWARELQKRYPPNPKASRGVAQVIRSGQAEFMSEIPAELVEPLKRDPEMSKLLDELQLTGTMTVPLTLHGQTLGAISLVSAESRLRYTTEDLELAEELARRITVAIENARLYHTAQQLNQELEQRVVERTGQLRESEEKFSKAFLASPAAMSIASASDGRYMDVNKSMAEMTGYSREELLGHTSLELGLVDHEARAKILQAAKEHGFVRDVEIQVHTRSNQILDVLVSLEQIVLNDQACMLSIQYDITERKRAEAEVRRLNQELGRSQKDIQRILDSMATLNAKVALDGTLVFVNKIAIQASGLAYDELLKTNFLEGPWWSFDSQVQSRVKEAFVRACAGTTINYDEKIFVFGRVLTINFSLTPMLGPNGEVEYILAEGRDITELKKLNEELEQRRVALEATNKELEAFSYSVSHDLRAPLRAVSGFSQALSGKYSDQLGEQGQHYLNRIQRNTSHMGQLIDDLLSLSRISRREMKQDVVKLSGLAHEIAAELRAQDSQREVRFEVEEQLEARGDAGLIRIVLQNLLANAWKFTSTRPQAHIQFGQIHASNDPTAEGPVYFVKDNGVGFDMAYANKLFGAFQRLHSAEEFPGTGIGLATVQRIIHRHGGRIWVESELDKGATFYFTLGEKHEI